MQASLRVLVRKLSFLVRRMSKDGVGVVAAVLG